MIKNFKKAFKIMQNKLFFVLFFMIQFFFLSNLFKNRLFPFKNSSHRKATANSRYVTINVTINETVNSNDLNKKNKGEIIYYFNFCNRYSTTTTKGNGCPTMKNIHFFLNFFPPYFTLKRVSFWSYYRHP